MRLAILSDIHGNAPALRAVLADLRAQGGADRTWILGDLASALPYPVETMQMLRELKDANPETVEIIGGNVDRYLVTGQLRAITPKSAEDWANFADERRRREGDLQFALMRLTWEDCEFILKTLRRELSLEVPGYGVVIGFHGAPGNDEQNLLPDQPAHEILDALIDSEGRLAFGGHTHIPMDRDLGRWRMVNPGSIGLPNDGDPRACYAIATFENGEAQIDIRHVAFDVEAVIRELAAQGIANATMYTAWLRDAKDPRKAQ